jgi:hypothetical protein
MVQALFSQRRQDGLPKFMRFRFANDAHRPGLAPDAPYLAYILTYHGGKVQAWSSDAFSFLTADTRSVNPATVRELGKPALPCAVHVLNGGSGDFNKLLKREIAEVLVACTLLRPCRIFEKCMRGPKSNYGHCRRGRSCGGGRC